MTGMTPARDPMATSAARADAVMVLADPWAGQPCSAARYPAPEWIPIAAYMSGYAAPSMAVSNPPAEIPIA